MIETALSRALAEQCKKLESEYAQAFVLIEAGKLRPLTSFLSDALHQVAQAVQATLNDHARLTMEDIAMLCAAQIKSSRKSKQRCNEAHTLFHYTCLWLSETPTRH